MSDLRHNNRPNAVEDDLALCEQYNYSRRCVRHNVRLKADIQTDRSYLAWTHNLSEDGLCFELADQLENGREITVLLFLNHSSVDQAPIKARCRVVWHDGASKGTKHGGQFLFFAGDDKDRLKEWLATL